MNSCVNALLYFDSIFGPLHAVAVTSTTPTSAPIPLVSQIDWTAVSVVIATILGPILAVWASDYRRKKEEKRSREVRVFRSLMAARSVPASPSHVEAINLIELEFSRENRRNRKIIDEWQRYREHLDKDSTEPSWEPRRRELQNDLILAISNRLGYGFEKKDIERGVYLPTWQVTLDREVEESRRLWLEVLSGKRALPIQTRSEVPATESGKTVSKGSLADLVVVSPRVSEGPRNPSK